MWLFGELMEMFFGSDKESKKKKPQSNDIENYISEYSKKKAIVEKNLEKCKATAVELSKSGKPKDALEKMRESKRLENERDRYTNQITRMQDTIRIKEESLLNIKLVKAQRATVQEIEQVIKSEGLGNGENMDDIVDEIADKFQIIRDINTNISVPIDSVEFIVDDSELVEELESMIQADIKESAKSRVSWRDIEKPLLIPKEQPSSDKTIPKPIIKTKTQGAPLPIKL